jgi:hypothetical protein
MSPAQETQSMREIRQALTRETPVQRGRVNRYANHSSVVSAAGYKPQGLRFESH